MFSSLSSFLPVSLHSSLQKAEIRPDEDDEDDDPGSKSDANETGLPKKKKDKTANETFIFVRPPPAKTNHPLNLQVQLVPPNSRGPSGLTSASRQSLDLSASAPVTPANSAPTTPIDSPPATPVTATPGADYESGAPLTRTASNRSTASSTYSSNSTTSTASGSTTSSRRMIVPLYNLQAHNVMTNIIVDAGTDAKIARFTKRGIEMLDLAVLEPVEVYAGGGAPTAGDAMPPPHNSGFSTRTVGGRPSMTGGLLVPGSNGGGSSRPNSRPTTPDPANSSQASLASSSAHSHSQSHHVQPEPQPDEPPVSSTPSKRNLFGKLFKKKDASPSTPGVETPTLGHRRTLSALGGRPVSPNPTAMALPRTSMSSAHRSSVDLGGEEPVPLAPATGLRPPVLGLQPSVSSPVHPPKGRPGLYVWVVKRWLKGEGGGLLAVAKGMVKGQGVDGDITSEVELRFEWKRGKAKRKRVDKEKEKEREGEDGAERVSRRQPSHANLSTPAKRLSISVISRQSSFSTAASEDGHLLDAGGRRASVVVADEDSGEESDPEDSETPWTCTVKVRRLAAHHARTHSNHNPFGREGREEREREEDARDKAKWKKEVVRIKVGTLSPTPHHPKVVAMLKVPFPLPDVNVERMEVRKREGGGHGSLNAAMKPGHGLLISAEEIKDIVCSTGLWLVVREGFGGIGKVSRKGDGWRIRG
ncbi:hypothetical protein C8R43DRAFT_1002049 [Mycena crocata]|nr:hypothetical protein C8R43DRAFT_1002049 [Mycena crocata]